MNTWTIVKLTGWMAVLALAMLLLVPDMPARANPAGVTSPQLVSGLTPLPREGEPGWCGSHIGGQDWEFDDTLAVNPTNPNNLAVAWVQDINDGIVVGYSIDGGASWDKAIITPRCAVPGQVSADDPWLSFGPDGVLYLSWRQVGPSQSPSALIVDRSLDGGRTWPLANRRVLDVAALPAIIDGSYVIADPARPGYAYATWIKVIVIPDPTMPLCFDLFANHYVSHTEDGGLTWSPPSEVPRSDSGGGGYLLVLNDGTLLDVIFEFDDPPTSCSTTLPPSTLTARRSSDFGATWSDPRTIATNDDAGGHSAAVAPDGTVYVSWPTQVPGTDDPRPFSVMYSKSTDDGTDDVGVKWQSPAPVGDAVLVGPAEALQSGALARPGLAVAEDGTVGVAFYDRRNATEATNRNRVDYWFRHSHDGGLSWTEDHLAGPYSRFRSFTEGVSGDDFRGLVGGVQGIAPIPGGFAASFAMGVAPPGAPPLAEKSTDIFFSRIRIPKPDLQVTNITPSKTHSLREGDKITLTATLENKGDADAPASTTEFVLDGSTVLGAVATGPIPAGRSLDVSVGWDTAGVRDEHIILVTADSTDVVTESDENNNKGQLTVIVQGNKVANPYFEQSNEQGTGPAGWTPPPDNGAGTASWNSAGTVSLTGNGGSVMLAGSLSWTSDDITVTAGQTLALRVSLRSDGMSSPPTAGLTYLSAVGDVIGTATLITAPLNSQAFTTLEAGAVVPVGVVKVRVVLSGFSPLDARTAGTVTFDDVGLFGD